MEALFQLLCIIAGIGLIIWGVAATPIIFGLIIAGGILLALGGVWIIFIGDPGDFFEDLHDLFT